MEALNAIVSEINGFLWSSVIIILLVGAGFYFTVRTRGVQIRYFTKMFSLITESAGKKTAGNEISPFQAFCVSTASRVGVGNIAGIAIAITAGSGCDFLDVVHRHHRLSDRLLRKYARTDL